MQHMWANAIMYLVAIPAVEAITEILIASELTDFIRTWLAGIILPAPDAPEEAPKDQLVFKSWRDVWNATGEVSPVFMYIMKPVAIFLAAKAYKLWTCGWCMSVWVAGGVAISVGPLELFGEPSFVTWALSTFVLHRAANWFHVAFELFKRGRVDTKDIELKMPQTLTVKLERELLPPEPTVEWSPSSPDGEPDVQSRDDLVGIACRAAVMIDAVRTGKHQACDNAVRAATSALRYWLISDLAEGDLLLLYRAVADHDNGLMMTLGDVKTRAQVLANEIEILVTRDQNQLRSLRNVCMAISTLANAMPQRQRQF